MDYTSLLPVETLCYVFVRARCANPVPSAEDVMKRDFAAQSAQIRGIRTLAWLNLTHVDSRWRKVAVDNPDLWTDVPVILGIEWMRAFVERSMDMAISIDWRSLEYMKSRYIDAAVPQVENDILPLHYQRVSNLVVTLPRRLHHTLLQLLSTSWPKLEEIDITVSHDVSELFALLNHDLPRLRCLTWRNSRELVNVLFPWEAPAIRSLTYLRLELPWGMHSSMMGRFLDAIACIPSIEHLQYQSLYIRHDSMPEPCLGCNAARRVHLPSLKTLLLDTELYESHHIMSHILPPAGIHVRLHDNIGPPINEDDMNERLSYTRNICSQLVVWYQGLDTFPPFVFAGLFQASSQHCHMWLSRSTVPPTVVPVSNWHQGIDGHQTDLEIVFAVTEGYFPSAMMAILQSLTPQSILAISFDASIRVFSSLMTSFLDPIFRNVVALHFPEENGGFCLQALSKPSNAMIPFPQLKVLAFTNSALRGLLSLVSNHAYDIEEDSLENYVSARRAIGAPIHTVYLGAMVEVQRARNGQITSTTCAGHLSRFEIEIKSVINRLEALPEVVFLREGTEALHNDGSWQRVVGSAQG
ncbi:hypothetical protein PENSPDRAFT_690796 [Peniophora sp. CONT]|nr:hypothetical protein PENSPDRAFT_690796 [Peniophora sp. CONT]